MNDVIVYKNRTTLVNVNLGFDVSADTFTSQIRRENRSTSLLIASWDVAFLTDGTDGRLVLSLDNSITNTIYAKHGYMDMKRISGGEPLPVFNSPIRVVFRETVTV